MDDTGRATTAWEESDGATVRTFTRDFDGSGAAAATEFDPQPTYRQDRPASACRPRGTRVVRSSEQSTVFVRRGSRFACLLGRGVPVLLFGDRLFPRRTIALAGPLVAYAYDFTGENEPTDEFPQQTQLVVRDLRDEVSGVNRRAYVEDARTGELAATRLRADGAVAWISCPSNQSAYGRLSPACERPGGRLKHVWALDSTLDEPRRLDAGRRIDPHSLTLSGSELTWRRRGRLHRAQLG
jgi:hypothetical protein